VVSQAANMIVSSSENKHDKPPLQNLTYLITSGSSLGFASTTPALLATSHVSAISYVPFAAVPGSLNFELLTSNSLTLTWTGTANDEYKVYREAAVSGATISIANATPLPNQVSSKTTSFTFGDSGLSASTTYDYWVVPIDTYGVSGNPATLSVSTPGSGAPVPATPTNVMATLSGGSTVAALSEFNDGNQDNPGYIEKGTPPDQEDISWDWTGTSAEASAMDAVTFKVYVSDNGGISYTLVNPVNPALLMTTVTGGTQSVMIQDSEVNASTFEETQTLEQGYDAGGNMITWVQATSIKTFSYYVTATVGGATSPNSATTCAPQVYYFEGRSDPSTPTVLADGYATGQAVQAALGLQGIEVHYYGWSQLLGLPKSPADATDADFRSAFPTITNDLPPTGFPVVIAGFSYGGTDAVEYAQYLNIYKEIDPSYVAMLSPVNFADIPSAYVDSSGNFILPAGVSSEDWYVPGSIQTAINTENTYDSAHGITPAIAPYGSVSETGVEGALEPTDTAAGNPANGTGTWEWEFHGAVVRDPAVLNPISTKVTGLSWTN